MQTLQKLQEKLSNNARENVSLSQYSTFKLGGPARYFFIAKTSADIVKAATAAKELNLEIFLLAGGSNLLIADSGFDGLVIKAENKEINVSGENQIKAEGGASWTDFVNFARENSLSGVAWGAGIPGTVGGAVRGNAGAFGRSVHEVIKSVEVLDSETATTRVMINAECNFEYRESIFKKHKNLIILDATFQLQKGDKAEIEKEMNERLAYRKNSQPCLPSAGCTFKNIIVTDEIKKKLLETIEAKELEEKIRGGKLGSAFLIDKAGLKGHQIGGVKISAEHANFIVKVDDTAKTDHVVQLISYIKQQVRDQFGIQLLEEVQYVGF
jgi:UDP-N-acetylmuramate dehydrogenase